MISARPLLRKGDAPFIAIYIFSCLTCTIFTTRFYKVYTIYNNSQSQVNNGQHLFASLLWCVVRWRTNPRLVHTILIIYIVASIYITQSFYAS